LASDRTDRRKVIIVACLGAAAAALAIVFLHDAWDRGILSLAFLFGFTAFPVYSLCVAHTNDFVAPAEYVEASSGLLLTYGVGAVLGPMIASLLMGLIGGVGLFAFTAGVHAAMAAFAAWRMTRRAPAPQEERVEFAEAMVSGQTISPIDLHPEARSEEDAAGYP